MARGSSTSASDESWGGGGILTSDGLVLGPAIGIHLVEVEVEAARRGMISEGCWWGRQQNTLVEAGMIRETYN